MFLTVESNSTIDATKRQLDFMASPSTRADDGAGAATPRAAEHGSRSANSLLVFVASSLHSSSHPPLVCASSPSPAIQATRLRRFSILAADIGSHWQLQLYCCVSR